MTTPDRLLEEQPAWFVDAECRGLDPDIFFPERGAAAGGNTPAKRICAMCEVRVECLEYALANNERSGIWGGYGERERRRIARARRRAA